MPESELDQARAEVRELGDAIRRGFATMLVGDFGEQFERAIERLIDAKQTPAGFYRRRPPPP
jgi:hypothetical protein